MEIKGDHVLITGGCGDVGLDIAKAFLDQGKRVTLVDLNITPGEGLAAEHERTSLVELDLADPDAVAARLNPLARSPDAPDVLIDGVGWTPKTNAEGKPWTTWEMPVGHFSRVVAVNPGRIDTQMIKDVPDEANQAIAARIPVGRLGLPADVAKVCLFLAADLADYLTGTTTEVNGGLYVGP